MEYIMEQQELFFAAVAVFIAILSGTAAGIWLYMRKKYISYTEKVLSSIDDILAGRGTERFDVEEETLLSKVQMKLKKLAEITAAAARKSEEREQEVQGIISDISHQLKTPIANIVMYCDTAMNPKVPEEKRAMCMEILKDQVDKLDFLVQAMIRMSRLEQNIIALHQDKVSLQGLLERAVRSIRARAADKNIRVELICEEDAALYCDEKWTTEALFNVLDNAVKYSPQGSRIAVRTERLEIYTKINITDQGVGISPEHTADVCKRFFREEKVAKTEGVGIGLYLTREILDKEKGYLKIRSEEGSGTTVSVFLVNAD